jgi:hypothetical protein
MAETASTIRMASKYAAKILKETDESFASIKESAEALHEIVDGLSPSEISTSRSTPWITRTDSKNLLSLSEKLQEQFDAKGIITLALDLTRQSAMFLELMSKHGRLIGGRGEDTIEEYLTYDQLMNVLEWVEAGKQRRLVRA